jgi:hypothetical protein
MHCRVYCVRCGREQAAQIVEWGRTAPDAPVRQRVCRVCGSIASCPPSNAPDWAQP